MELLSLLHVVTGQILYWPPALPFRSVFNKLSFVVVCLLSLLYVITLRIALPQTKIPGSPGAHRGTDDTAISSQA